MTGVDPKLEALARAYDSEDASQRGEPSPWADEGDGTFPAWRAERLACAQAGLDALAALTPLKGAPPTHRHLKSGHLVRVIGEAATELVNFAWSTVVTDCTESAEYLNELVDNLRVALASLPLLPPGEEEPGLTSHEAIKNLIGMVRAEAASWREPESYEPRDAAEEAAFLDVIADTLAALSPTAPELGTVPSAIREAMQLAVDYLKETKQGNPARSAGHNARLILESALCAVAPQGDKP